MATPVRKEEDSKVIMKKAMKRALGGGVSGGIAMGVQVLSMMWLRTTMNFQYRHGMSTTQALKHLYNEGGRGVSGVRRFYRGVAPGLIQGPLSRFGDTAANSGMLALLESRESTRNLPTPVKTIGASLSAAAWRIFLMPVDACKTTLQVEGKAGMAVLGKKIAAEGPKALYHGSLAAYSATLVGHFPWFATYNYLNEVLPKADTPVTTLARRAAIGFTASVVSDCCSNSIRVLKTTRQTSAETISYSAAAKQVIQAEGIMGLLGRGLKTRILVNGLQGCLFSVLWKAIEGKLNQRM